jgi:hypothetical protein
LVANYIFAEYFNVFRTPRLKKAGIFRALQWLLQRNSTGRLSRVESEHTPLSGLQWQQQGTSISAQVNGEATHDENGHSSE